MKNILPLSVGAAASGLLFSRARAAQQGPERLSAATLETLLNAIDCQTTPRRAPHVRRGGPRYTLSYSARPLTSTSAHCVASSVVALFHDIGKLHGALSDNLSRAVEAHARRNGERSGHILSGGAGYVLAPAQRVLPRPGKGCRRAPRALGWLWVSTRVEGGKAESRSCPAWSPSPTASIAITYRRRYSHARSFAEATARYRCGPGEHKFDPELVDLFLTRPVQARIGKALREANMPRKESEARTEGWGETQSVPDITFRWRPRSLEPQSQDRQP